MLKLHCTKKLAAKLATDPLNALSSDHSNLASNVVPFGHQPLSNWHANLLILQRRNCVLFLHDQTRFPVIVIGVLKKDFANLNRLLEEAFLNALLKIGATQEQFEVAGDSFGRFSVDTICSRSVQGTMNQMTKNLEHQMWFDNLKINELSSLNVSLWLAEMPCRVKGQRDYIWPPKAMLELLSKLCAMKKARFNH